jgi:hypothetical protein
MAEVARHGKCARTGLIQAAGGGGFTDGQRATVHLEGGGLVTVTEAKGGNDGALAVRLQFAVLEEVHGAIAITRAGNVAVVQDELIHCLQRDSRGVELHLGPVQNLNPIGIVIVEEIVTLFREHNLNTQVLAASFKNPEQVHKVALCGGHAVTVAPEIFPALINHPLTDKAVKDFMNDWSGVYGDKKVLDLLGK